MSRLIEEKTPNEEIQKDVKEVADQLFSVIEQFTKTLERFNENLDKDRWVPISQLPSYLGDGFRPYIVRSKIRNGEFQYGVHYIDTSNGQKPNYLVNPLEVERYYRVPPEYRD